MCCILFSLLILDFAIMGTWLIPALPYIYESSKIDDDYLEVLFLFIVQVMCFFDQRKTSYIING
ncbi:hypothetical protein EMLAB_00810 [Enterococcus mundtii]|nr:hypothetical protein EMLAB_00810 [Enterococcus mundtii]